MEKIYMVKYKSLTTYKKEDYLEIEILKYLQALRQPTTRQQLAEYLVKNVDTIPNDSMKYLKSRKTGKEYQPFMNRVGFALTSLYKAQLINHPKRGITVLTKLGYNVDVKNKKYIHQLVMKGWGKDN